MDQTNPSEDTTERAVVPSDADSFIRSRIFTIRGVQVMLDRDLAEIYAVPTKRLNEQVKRNLERFPPSFKFSLSKQETEELVANCDRFVRMKHSSVPMTAFTEHGIIMLASVLKSAVAIQAGIRITNAFVSMRKAQYPSLSLRFRENFHDRFLVVDDRDLYLIGASLKDLGKKCFGFTKMDSSELPGLKVKL